MSYFYTITEIDFPLLVSQVCLFATQSMQSPMPTTRPDLWSIPPTQVVTSHEKVIEMSGSSPHPVQEFAGSGKPLDGQSLRGLLNGQDPYTMLAIA